MDFWLIAALLTLGASGAVLWPFLRRAPAVSGAASDHDLEVYRDQLSEIDRDAANGLVGGVEAAEAKAEIGRRILKLGDDEKPAARLDAGDLLGKAFATAAVLAVPIVGWGAYLALGSPGLPDQQLEARLVRNPSESSLDELVARAELHLTQNPNDGRGWDVIAPIYLRLGRAEEAVSAFRNAIRLNGSSAEREGGLGQAIAVAAGGVVTSEAQAAFQRALEGDPKDQRSRFFLAMGYAQEGRTEEAKALWQAMTADLPPQSPWRGAAMQELARLETPGGDAAPASPAGPTADQMQAAADMPAQDRQAMIEGMVAQLDARLRENPDDIEGWQRLVRSYHVLGKEPEAKDALARGVNALGEGSERSSRLIAFAGELGIKP